MTSSARFTTGWRVLMLVVASVAVATPDRHELAQGTVSAKGIPLVQGTVCPGGAVDAPRTGVKIVLGARYPALGAPPIAQAIRSRGSSTGTAAAPSGAQCFGKSESGVMWVTVAGVFRAADDPAALIARFGAISQLLGVQYWSTTEQEWRPLALSAYATTTTNSDAKPRADYSVAELSTGSDRYYRLADSRSGHDVVYRLKLRSSQPAGMVFETANAEPIKQWGLTFYSVGGLRTLYFLNERAPGVWAYYSITRVLPNSFLARGHEKSYINRAVALYRHYAGIPTNAEPPAAR